MGNLFKRGERYWLRYSLNGVEHREPARTTKRSEAQALLDRRMSELREGLVGRNISTTTIDDLIPLIVADYENNGRKSLRDMQRIALRMRDAFKGLPVVAISYDHLEQYVAKRRKDGVAARTIQLELVTFGRMCKLGVRARKLSEVPQLPTIKVQNARQGFFERTELDAVLKHLPEWFAAFIETAYITGWRAGELRGLEWKNVDFDAGEMRLEATQTKNGRARIFPISAHARLTAILKAQRTRMLSPYVFPNSKGVQIGDYQKMWKTACKKAGLPGRLVHDLRRTAVRNLMQAGVAQQVAMKISGHETASVFERYNIITTADVCDAIRKVEQAGTQ